MNISFLEFNFVDFEFVTLLQCTTKTFAWYLISQKQFICEIHKINPTQNLRLLQYFFINPYFCYKFHSVFIEMKKEIDDK